MFEAVDGSKRRYALALLVGFVSIATFTAMGAAVQLWYERRLRHPLTWFRLITLSTSIAVVLLPVMAASVVPGHHPRQFADPDFLPRWLHRYDPVTGTMPLWGSHPGPAPAAPVA